MERVPGKAKNSAIITHFGILKVCSFNLFLGIVGYMHKCHLMVQQTNWCLFVVCSITLHCDWIIVK